MIAEAVQRMNPQELLDRREIVRTRMSELSSNGGEDTQTLPGSKEVHWDLVMKEMKWLADDFQKERQRHIGNAKKITKAVDVHHKTKDARKLKKSRDEVVALKKISSKLSRDVRKFWLKINKVVAFKQKIDADEVRQKAMDKHLVFLVKQTERYTNMLAENMNASLEDADDDRSVRSGNSSAPASPGKARSSSHKQLKAQDEARYKAAAGSSKRPELLDAPEHDSTSHEQDEHNDSVKSALEASRLAKRKLARTSTGSADAPSKRVKFAEGDGASEVTEGSDASGSDDGEFEFEDEQDDETTLIEEERRRQLDAGGDAEEAAEIALLQEEGEIPIEQLRAMYANMPAYDSDEQEEEGSEEEGSAEEDGPQRGAARKAPNADAHSEASASGEEDADDDGEFEFEDEQDDETTLIEEERRRQLDREKRRAAQQGGSSSSAAGDDSGDEEAAEIALLQEEGEIPIEQLRAMYANMPAYDSDEGSEGEEGDDEEASESDQKSVEDAPTSSGAGAPSSKAAASTAKTSAAKSGVEPEGDAAGSDAAASGEEDNGDDDGEFEFQEELDDETTLIEEERQRQLEREQRRNRRGASASETDAAAEDSGDDEEAAEIALLQEEGEIPIEQLRAMYANMPAYDSDEEDGEGSVGEEDSAAEETSDIRAARSKAESTSSSSTERAAKPAASAAKSSAADADNASESQGSGAEEDGDDDGEFEFEDEQDDETTLIEEERRRQQDREKRAAAGDTSNADDVDEAAEIALLQEEGEIPIEQLRAMYANMPAYDSDDGEDEGSGSEGEGSAEEDQSEAADSDDAESDDDDGEFEFEDEQDDETTLIEEERRRQLDAGGDVDEAAEIALLQEEGEIPIEQLRAMYANMPAYDSDEEDEEGSEGEESAAEEDADQDSDAMSVEPPKRQKSARKQASKATNKVVNKTRHSTTTEEGAMDVASSEGAEERECNAAVESKEGDGDADGAVAVVDPEESNDYDVEDAIHRLEAADLAARSIRVDRPFVLSKKMTLREYQHIGLNWLVSLHERRLNGILADEMGLGKTIQTISLLAYLAVNKGLWGPHLIIVPTSCIVNWETELKKFCPIFKVLTYFGSAKKRKFLRSGWSKLNSFHICITSYQIVVQDSNAFRRKRWYYMILDEAHNIKNFKSKRWQTLLNFNTQRRLLLTGTPLQNNLMELWSLMHFLMPHIFRSRKEFSYWFSNPLSGMVEGNRGINNDLIGRLHSIMRPFLLRRLKKDVAKQLPGKYEHIVMCRLSKRQLHLYEEFMARTTTKSSLNGGNFLGMMNILMQLRKVCNHPDLFEPRPISSPFVPASVTYRSPAIVVRALDQGPLSSISPGMLQFWSFDRDSTAAEALSQLRVSRNSFVQVEDVSLGYSAAASNKPQFQRYVAQLRAALQQQLHARCEFNYAIMDERTTKPNLCYNWRLCRAVSVLPFTTQVIQARYSARLARDVTPCWYELIKTVDDRVRESVDMVAQFVFVLPKVVSSGVEIISIASTPSMQRQLRKEFGAGLEKTQQFMRNALLPFYPALIRQRIFFPDRKLIQFDSGKLQTLAVLLRDLKKGGHKCLIFTQMSKMLDILEIFLNLHDHTFVRLDGSTSIERRQKLMDRFNSDPKLFVFILSTRSGGLGINLTGADTVIFYDTDWNPAMDAQAQDRAHRIGQTRDVHIYRLVSESTVEENILTKAKQKRHLDFLVMTEGNFSEASLFSGKGLKDLLGVETTAADADVTAGVGPSSGAKPAMNAAEIEAAMLAAEDEDDVRAMKAATLEATKDLDEFDEQAVVEPGLDDDGEGPAGTAGAGGTGASAPESAVALVSAADEAAAEEKDMEKEFASWQASLGPDFKALEAALKPIERYALRIRTEVEPYYSIFYITEQARLEAVAMSNGGEGEVWNVEEIEREKEEEEMRALSEGELLATNVTRRDNTRLRSWFLQERSRRVAARRLRTMTGAAWAMVQDGGVPYWYNSDTGEASYNTPGIIEEQEKLQWAREQGYNAMPLNIMLHIFSYLLPYPERCQVAPLCARWAEAACHESFRKRVLPVETGARDPTKRSHKLSPNVFASIEEAIAGALPGDTIELGMGHHWEGSLVLDKPLRLVCESGGGDDCSKCVIELTGQVLVTPAARAVVIFGVTLRRPRRVQGATSCIVTKQSNLSVFNSVINNDGAKGSAIRAVGAPWVRIANTQLTFGTYGIHAMDSSLLISNCTITDNAHSGIALLDSECYCEDSYIHSNAQCAVSCVGGDELAALVHCDLRATSGKLFSSEFLYPTQANPAPATTNNSSSCVGANASASGVHDNGATVSSSGLSAVEVIAESDAVTDSIYTLNCITEAASAAELRQHPWYTRAAGLKKAGSRASFDTGVLNSGNMSNGELTSLANNQSVNSLEDYDVPNGAGGSKKRVRL